MVNQAVHPLVTNQRVSEYPIELATVTGVSVSPYQIATIKLADTQQIEVILVTDLSVDTYNMPLPKEWLGFKSHWYEQITQNSNVNAQILLGSDQAKLHPLDALDESGLPIESAHAHLKKSVLTGKFIAHSHNPHRPKASLSDQSKHTLAAINIITVDDQPHVVDDQPRVIKIDLAQPHTIEGSSVQSQYDRDLIDLTNKPEIIYNIL